MSKFNIILFSIFLVLGFTGGAAFIIKKSAPCQFLNYDIGVFDERFNLSRDKLIKTIEEAELIWEDESGQNLFEYKPGSKFKINFVFDERQERTNEATQSKSQIDVSKESYDSLVSEYKIKAANYENALNNYNTSMSDFQISLDNYNRQVAQINSKGGATPKQYQDLESQRKNLESRKNYLDSQRTTLNQNAQELNILRDQINEMARQLNIQVDVFNKEFGESKEFDQGEYRGNDINIYQFDGISDLRIVLAHELGHALGIGHVPNPESIMYYLIGQQDMAHPALSNEDISAFKETCNLSYPEILKYQYNNFVSKIENKD